MNPKNIYFEAAKGEPNTVILHVPVHYPGTYEQEDEHNPKKRLAVLKRALQRIRQEIVNADTRIESDAIKASGQINIIDAINNGGGIE